MKKFRSSGGTSYMLWALLKSFSIKQEECLNVENNAPE